MTRPDYDDMTERACLDGVPPATTRGPWCRAPSPRGYACTRTPQHKGDHVAHAGVTDVCDRWAQ